MKSALRSASCLQALSLTGLAVGALSISAPALAQDIATAQLSGSVVDDMGSPISGATVTIEANNRGLTRTATTGGTGSFTFTGLPLGTYDIVVSAEGYGTTRVSSAAAGLGGSAYTIAMTSQTSDANEIVVSANVARTLDFSQTATGQVFNVQEVAEALPVPRTLESIALLAPQVVAGDTSFSTDNPNGVIALGGSSVAENIYYINGMNVTNFRTFIGGSTVPFEFYDQVQVKTGGYQAEFGRSTGGALIAVSRSGSNELRGGANFYYEPNSLRSTQPNTYTNLNENDEVTRWDGNMWASGALVEDRVYFFAFYNPRHYRSYGENVSRTSRSELTSDTPFYGGKIDVDLFDGHRVEFTYFNDSNTDKTITEAYDDDGAGNLVQTRRTFEYDYTGGENYMARYTGSFTNWLTLSLMYGKSKYERRTTGSDASVPYTVNVNQDFNGQPTQFIQGIGALLDNGQDTREAFRADLDIFVDFLGSHHIRLGADYEKLNAVNTAGYSGGEINYFYRNWGATPTSFGILPGETYLRRIVYLQSGEFENQNTAFYIQDNWDITDRLQVSLGVRNDRFRNLGIGGIEFVDLKNQWAPRLGATYDLFGDRRTRLSAFYGRYYLPVAANTNLRMAGQEQYYEDIYRYTGTYTDYEIVGPSLRNIVYSDVTDPDPSTLVSQNLKPQFMDEFIIGAEHRLGDSWRIGLNLVHRNLKNVLEDSDLGLYTMGAFCADNTEACGGEETLDVGSGGYVLLNPGSDVIINVSPQGGFEGGTLTIPAEYVAIPKASRKYWAAELSFDREWDGKWMLGGSYTWSKTRGNYEGGVKSDIGQDDVGLTQDFDEPGWTDGSYGNLPNDRRHQFKLYGNYAVTDNFAVGANARLISGRSFGCMGIYPLDDGRAIDSGYDSWYCGNRDYFGPRAVDDDGPISGNGSTLVGRGNAFRGAWEKRLDLNFTYRVPIDLVRDLRLRLDVFNVLNFDSPIDYNEYGDLDTSISPPSAEFPAGEVPLNVNYGKATAYQTPRYVRFGVSLDF